MTTSWKTKYGIEWEKRMKKFSCPICNGYMTASLGVRSAKDGSMRQRFYKCKDCEQNFQTIEIDTERYLDLIETEQIVEHALKVEEALKVFNESIRRT